MAYIAVIAAVAKCSNTMYALVNAVILARRCWLLFVTLCLQVNPLLLKKRMAYIFLKKLSNKMLWLF